MIRYREIRPSARLRPFVHTFWILEHDGEEGVQRVVPDGHSELILNWASRSKRSKTAGGGGSRVVSLPARLMVPCCCGPLVQRRCWGLDFSHMELLVCLPRPCTN